MGASPFSCARFASRPLLRGVVTYLGLPPRHAPAVLRHVLPKESSSAGIDAPPGRAEAPRRDVKNYRAGLQYRGRSLFDPLDHPLGAAALESAPECGGYFGANIELR